MTWGRLQTTLLLMNGWMVGQPHERKERATPMCPSEHLSNPGGKFPTRSSRSTCSAPHVNAEDVASKSYSHTRVSANSLSHCLSNGSASFPFIPCSARVSLLQSRLWELWGTLETHTQTCTVHTPTRSCSRKHTDELKTNSVSAKQNGLIPLQ